MLLLILIAGWFIIPIISAFYERKTGTRLFPYDDEDMVAVIGLWPIMIPILGLIKVIACLFDAYFGLLEKIRKG